jgi:hypothetical protein
MFVNKEQCQFKYMNEEKLNRNGGRVREEKK